MIDPPVILQTASQQHAFIPVVVSRADIVKVMDPGIREIVAALKAQGIPPTGPWYSHHRRIDPATFDFEICFPVASALTPVGRVQMGELPAGTVARTVYRGPYEGLGSAWGELKSWVKNNGHAASGDLWERYHSGPESNPDPASFCTELNQPLKV